MTENPPSTGIAVPVTKSEPLEERNTAMPAKIGDRAPARRRGARQNLVVQSIDFLPRPPGEIGVDPARQHRVDLDVVGGPGDRAGTRELHDAAFARGVSRREACAEDRHHRADVDDLAAACFLHGRVDRLRAQERAGEIGPDDAIPFLEIERVRGFADVDAGVVDENVDPAELPPDALDHGGDRGLVGDISGDGYRFGAGLFEFSDRRGRLRFVAPDDCDAGAGFRQSPRHAKAYAAIAAGDDSDLAAEIESFSFHHWCPLAFALPDQDQTESGERRAVSGPLDLADHEA